MRLINGFKKIVIYISIGRIPEWLKGRDLRSRASASWVRIPLRPTIFFINTVYKEFNCLIIESNSSITSSNEEYLS